MNILIISDRFTGKINSEEIKNYKNIIESIDFVPWNEKFNCPAIESYEIVIVDMWNLYSYKDNNELISILKNNLDILRKALLNVINSKRLWIVILDKYFILYKTMYKTIYSIVDILYWLPQNLKDSIEPKENPGFSIELIDKNYWYKVYFNNVKEWHYIIKDKFDFDCKIIAQIKNSMPISMKYTKLYEPSISSLSESEKLGTILFLPNSKKEEKDLILNILEIAENEYEEYYNKFKNVDNEPEWIEEYKIKEILDLENELKEYTNQINNELEFYKNIYKILYKTGKELEDAIYIFFKNGPLKKLINTSDNIDLDIRQLESGSHIDFELYFNIDNKKIVFGLEVTSSNEWLKKDNSKIDQIMLSEIKTDNYILLVNTYHHLPPLNRLDKIHFTNECIDLYEQLTKLNKKVTLITTIDLFILYILLKEKRINFKEFFEILYSGNLINLSKNKFFKEHIEFFKNYFKGGKNV